jgi:predicted amidohydrolase YtcJ
MELILHNGNIITMDESCPKVSAVGSDAEIMKLTFENTKVPD